MERVGSIKVVQYQNQDYTDTACIIALAAKEEQFVVYQDLLRIGLKEEQIFRMNDRIWQAVIIS